MSCLESKVIFFLVIIMIFLSSRLFLPMSCILSIPVLHPSAVCHLPFKWIDPYIGHKLPYFVAMRRKEPMRIQPSLVFHTQKFIRVTSFFSIAKCDWFNSKINYNLIFFQLGISKLTIHQPPNYRQCVNQQCQGIFGWISQAIYIKLLSSAMREGVGY